MLALPLLVVLVWLGYRFVSDSTDRATSKPDKVAKPAEPAPPVTATVVETPRIEAALLEAGVDRDRMKWENGHLRLETFDSIDAVAAMVRSKIPGATVERDGEILVIGHDDAVERLRVVVLQRDTEDEGFIPVDEAPVAPSAATKTPGKGARKIVLIIDDVGYENQPLEKAAAIDARLNFAVIPGTPRATRSAEFLASRGFEVLCHLPMEPLDYPNVSPGDRAIFTSMPDDEIRRLARENIDSIPYVKGVNNHMGSRATRDRRVMQSVADVLLQEGVYFIDSRTAGSSIAAQVTRSAGIPTGTRDVFLDDDPSERAVRRQLKLLAHLSESRKFVIGIGHVYPTTVNVLRDEIPRLTKEGYEFLFASEVLR